MWPCPRRSPLLRRRSLARRVHWVVLADRPRLKSALSILLTLLCALASCPVAASLAFYLVGNGITAGAGALAGLLALLVVVALRWIGRARTSRVPSNGLVAGMIVALLGFGLFRLATVGSGAPIVYCEDGRCLQRGPFLSMLIREDESARSGVAVAEALGALFAREHDAPELFAEKYRLLEVLRSGEPGVNALLVPSSTAHLVRSIAYLPSGAGRTPGIVFLHGSGGSMSTYVSTLLESDELAQYAIIAPVVDAVGLWSTDEAMAVVERTVQTLPASVDRSRLYIVGLSNGAVGATAVASRPDVARLFRAAVAIEGIASAETTGPTGPTIPLLALAARDDERFELEYVRERVDAMRDANAPVELSVVDGTHMAFFANSGAFTTRISAWLKAH